MQHSRLIACATLVLAAGCSSTPAAQGSAPVGSLNPAPMVMRFVGQFRPVMNTSSGSAMASGSTRIIGSVRMTGDPGSDDRFTVTVNFTSERGTEALYWSVVDGSCGGASLPLVPPRDLPLIDVPANGQVRFSSDFRATMQADATYHLNLYANGGTDIESVIGCANLKRG